jgi:hypothetical protein
MKPVYTLKGYTLSLFSNFLATNEYVALWSINAHTNWEYNNSALATILVTTLAFFW